MSAATVEVARSAAEETLRSVQRLRLAPVGPETRPGTPPAAVPAAARPAARGACDPRLPAHAVRTGRPAGARPGSVPRVRLVPVADRVRPSVADPLAVPPRLEERVETLRARDRAALAAAQDEPRRDAEGDARALAAAIAQASVEAVTGRRPVGQLARWLAPGVFQALRGRAALTARALRASESRAARGAVVRRLMGNALGPHAYEASAVVDDGRRVRAVGLRLETHRGAWRVTELDLA